MSSDPTVGSRRIVAHQVAARVEGGARVLLQRPLGAVHKFVSRSVPSFAFMMIRKFCSASTSASARPASACRAGCDVDDDTQLQRNPLPLEHECVREPLQ